ncbi:MAG: enoyl-CoA hydratase/isomerase family protein [Candidatus Marsarchaeota archaeon]|nr:enoyl-CoA hydratase/isomerase family protein [Candidatus Marsarchaeota archaeon]
MQYKKIRIAKKGSIFTIMLDDPEHLNVLSREMIKELHNVLETVSKDRSCRAVVITGAGTKAFCAGGDLRYIKSLENSSQVGKFFDLLKGVCLKIETMNKPVIAAINGYCLGGGLELALACDIRIASSMSKFGFPEVKLGIMPGGGGTYRLPSTVGMGNAKYMILTGEHIDSNYAFRIGLVNAVVARAKLLAYAGNIARTLSSNSQSSIKEAKFALYKNSKPDYSAERNGFIRCFKNKDKDEGIEAFIEHRAHAFDKRR